MLSVPQYWRPGGCRVARPLASLPVHETLTREIDADFHCQGNIFSCVHGRLPAYRQHTVTREALPQVAAPLALYLDGIQYATRDSTLGVFVVKDVC